MSDNFYDFDKDDTFDEIYLKKAPTPPKKKEFEIEIPMPQSGIKSTMESKITDKKVDNKKVDNKPVTKAPKRKKLSSTALTLIIIGIVFSSILTFLLSFVGTILGWNYLPSFEKTSGENSVVEDTKQIQEVIEISDDGNTVEVVPLYRDTEGDDAPPSDSDKNSEDEADNDDGSNSDESDSEEIPDNDTDNLSSNGSQDDTSSDDEIMVIE